MISENSLKEIAHIFCGDIEDLYAYKTGSQLVAFFNHYYNLNEKYGAGFPSRWIYVYDKLFQLIKLNRLDGFLDIILSNGKIIFAPSESHNNKAIRNRTLSDGTKQKFGEMLIQHEVRVLMTRGVNGMYIYACDPELRVALLKAAK